MISCSTFKVFDNFFEDESVPKEKYEDLLKKYKELVSKKAPMISTKSSTIADDRQSVDELRSKLLNKKDKAKPVSNYDRIRVQKDLGLLYQAVNKFQEKKFGDVIILLKELENSQVYRIRAQSRYLFGKTMEAQGETDLSMQIYEEILISMQDTIFALLSLERLLENTKTLGLKNKNQYFTQLYSRFIK